MHLFCIQDVISNLCVWRFLMLNVFLYFIIYVFKICLIDFYWSNKWDSFEEIICSWIVFFPFLFIHLFSNKKDTLKIVVIIELRFEFSVFLINFFIFWIILCFKIYIFEMENLLNIFSPCARFFPGHYFAKKFACGIGLKDVFIFESQCSLEFKLKF